MSPHQSEDVAKQLGERERDLRDLRQALDALFWAASRVAFLYTFPACQRTPESSGMYCAMLEIIRRTDDVIDRIV